MSDLSNCKVAICMPHEEMMPVDTHTSMVRMLIYMAQNHPGVIHDLHHAKGSDAAAARNHCLKDVDFRHVTHVLFVDSDMVFSPDHLEKLLESGKKCVSGVNFQKVGDFHPTIYKRDTAGEIQKLMEFPIDELFKVDGTGGAFILVHRDVLLNIKKKYGTKYFEWVPELSEDLEFCRRVMETGEDVWINSSVLTDHLTMAPRGFEDYLRRMEEKRRATGRKTTDSHGREFDPVEFKRGMIIPGKEKDPGFREDDPDVNGLAGSTEEQPSAISIQTLE